MKLIKKIISLKYTFEKFFIFVVVYFAVMMMPLIFGMCLGAQ